MNPAGEIVGGIIIREKVCLGNALIIPPTISPAGFILHAPTCLWRWNRQSVPKRRHIKFRRRGITQKKAYDIEDMAKVW